MFFAFFGKKIKKTKGFIRICRKNLIKTKVLTTFSKWRLLVAAGCCCWLLLAAAAAYVCVSMYVSVCMFVSVCLYVYMYVSKCACMYVCLYVCMFVCMYVFASKMAQVCFQKALG